jgi:hypothetical protein
LIRQGSHVWAWQGAAWLGTSRRGVARRGKARLGKVRQAGKDEFLHFFSKEIEYGY